MSILKSNYTQMILVGIIISLISGLLGFFSFSTIKVSSSQKKFIIIDVTKKNPLIAGITRFSSLNDFNSKVNSINEDYMQSLQWSILRYQRDEKLVGGCHNIQFELTDSSIFIETQSFLVKDEPIMTRCLNNLLDLSFQRLKSRIDSNTSEEILKISLIKDDLYLQKNALENKIRKNLNDKNDLQSIAKGDQQSIGKLICKQVDSFSPNNFLGQNFEIDSPSSMQTVKDIYFLSALINECDEINSLIVEKEIEKFVIIETEIDNLETAELNLQKTKKILISSNFNDIFKIEIFTNNLSENTNKLLSRKNVVLSFAILGFIFGILLIYNLRIFK